MDSPLQEKMLDTLSVRVEAEHSKLTAELKAKDQTILSVQQRLAEAERSSKQSADLQTQLDNTLKVR